MKHIILVFIAYVAYGLEPAIGQVQFSEDFESFNVGDNIVETSSDWTLWPGGSDTTISNDQAASGDNSLILQDGFGSDILLPFTGVFNEGFFATSMDIFVPTGGAAYYNIQGLETVGTGGVWSAQVFMEADGSLVVWDGTNTPVIEMTYEPDTWVNLRFEIGFESGFWIFYVDDEFTGSFTNVDAANSAASLNLFPRADGAGDLYYVDNVTFQHSFELISSTDDLVIDRSSLDVIPNPSSHMVLLDLVNVELSPESRLEIVNTLGKQMYRQDGINSKHQVDVSQWTQGQYFVKIIDGETLYTSVITKN